MELRAFDSPDGLYFRVRYSKPVLRIDRAWCRLLRRLRYGPVPAGGWGHGWHVLVFHLNRSRQEVHVLAPVKGLEFDWETLHAHVRGRPWPDYAHKPDAITGLLSGGGHHLLLTMDGYSPQRIMTGPLIPGVFRGGVDCDLTLAAVRPTGPETETESNR